MYSVEGGSDQTLTLYELKEMGYDLGLKEYAIFDEAYRETLNNAIYQYYETREIGFQNVHLFIRKLNQRLDLIMRNKYNDLYDIKKTEFNALYNIEMHENFTHTIKNENTTTLNANSKNSTSTTTDSDNTTKVTDNNKLISSHYASDEMLREELSDLVYADGMQQTLDSNSTSDKGSMTTDTDFSQKDNSEQKDNGVQTETYERTTMGSSAGLPFSKALMQFKQYIEKYQLDNEICKDLSDLFMSIY